MRLDHLPTHTKGGFHVVVESPRGSPLKLKFDPDLEVLRVQRPLPLGFAYPYDWGFVPGTQAPDGDPVDALVCWDVPSFPGVVIPCRALGVLRLEQDAKGGGRERNDRLLAIPLQHPRGEGLETVMDLPERVREEVAHFFTSSIYFEPKSPEVLGWDGPEAAMALVGAGPRPRSA